ncbi:hypothetical protein CDD83_5155 [Cordyceps sp. RAO-2017]|nr:hypothetical protein CDD83_5155 [Cordyceps sp. RAO-2017]
MSCIKRQGTTYLMVNRRDSLQVEACITSRDVVPECRSIYFEPRTKHCFYSDSSDQLSIAAEAFVSAHSLSCAACKKGCDQHGGDTEPLPADAPRCEDDHD